MPIEIENSGIDLTRARDGQVTSRTWYRTKISETREASPRPAGSGNHNAIAAPHANNYSFGRNEQPNLPPESLHSLLHLKAYRVKISDDGKKTQTLIAQQGILRDDVPQMHTVALDGLPKELTATRKNGTTISMAVEKPVLNTWHTIRSVKLSSKEGRRGFGHIRDMVAQGTQRLSRIQQGVPLSSYVQPVDIIKSLDPPESSTSAPEDTCGDNDMTQRAVDLFTAFGIELGTTATISGTAPDGKKRVSIESGSRAPTSRPGSAGSTRSGCSMESTLSGESSVSFMSATSGMTCGSRRSRASKRERQRRAKKAQLITLSNREPEPQHEEVRKYNIEEETVNFRAKLEATEGSVAQSLPDASSGLAPPGNANESKALGTDDLRASSAQRRTALTSANGLTLPTRPPSHSSARGQRMQKMSLKSPLLSSLARMQFISNRARKAQQTSVSVTSSLSQTLRNVKRIEASTDEEVTSALKMRDRDWNQDLPLKFENLIPRAHVSSGQYAALPTEIKRHTAGNKRQAAAGEPKAHSVDLKATSLAGDGRKQPEDFESDQQEHSLNGSQNIDFGDTVQYRDALIEVDAMHYRLVARQRSKLAEAVRRYQWFRPMLQHLAKDAQKRGGLPTCVLRFLSVKYRILTAGGEIDRSVIFIIMRHAFRTADDWKQRALEHIIPIVCEAFGIPQEHLQAWLTEYGIELPPSLQRILRKKAGRRNKNGGGSKHVKMKSTAQKGFGWRNFGHGAALGGLGSLDEGARTMRDTGRPEQTSPLSGSGRQAPWRGASGMATTSGRMPAMMSSSPRMRTYTPLSSTLEDHQEDNESGCSSRAASELSRASKF